MNIKKSIANLVLALLVFSVAQISWAKEEDLSCRYIAPILTAYLDRHVNYSELNKELEKRTIDQYLDKLDSGKLYLLEKDVAKIKSMLTGSFKKLKGNNCAGVESSHKLYVKRVQERVAMAKKYLGPKFKFDKNTTLYLDPEKRKRPKNDKESEVLLHKYIQFQISNYLDTDETLEKSKELVLRSYERNLRRVSTLSQDDLWTLYIDSFAHALDPHSSYFSKDALKDFQIQMSLSLEGIGASLSFKDGFTVIEQLIAGGAAYRSGKLKPKDRIVAVGQGKEGKFENVIEMDLREVVKKIRGPKGSTVRLTVTRKEGGETKRMVVNLIRDKIKLEDDAAHVYFQKRKDKAGVDRKVAVVTLPSFYADSSLRGRSGSKDLKKIFKQVREQKADSVVFDLSTNGGGSLDDAVKVAGLFFARGNVVKQSHRDPRRPELALADEDPSVDWAGPLVILIGRISASASEIVSGTLKEYRRAVIVGSEHTFGKGTVQSVEPLKGGDLGAIKTTVGMFFTAGGASTQVRGVRSDITFPDAFDDDDVGEAKLDYSLPPKTISPFLSAEAYVTDGPRAWDLVSKSTIKQLKVRSEKRVAASEKFKEIEKDLKEAKEKKDKPVKLSDLMSKRKDAKEEAKKKGEDLDRVLTAEEKEKKYFERADVQEAINIAVDYAEIDATQKKINLGSTRTGVKSSSN
ncbi:MAG: carboxy terminal-processing peptidase [Bdellovibrionales bacterium]|nr:carboxy terminal-processing peptidase [Bdellovibrionales bacterium]